MDLKSLQDELDIIAKEADSKKKQAVHKYCLANNTVGIGDIFKDHQGSIQVEKIQSYFNRGNPCCAYAGAVLTKKLKPAVSGAKRTAYQCDEVK